MANGTVDKPQALSHHLASDVLAFTFSLQSPHSQVRLPMIAIVHIPGLKVVA